MKVLFVKFNIFPFNVFFLILALLRAFENTEEAQYVLKTGHGMHCPCHFNCMSLEYFPDFFTQHIPNGSDDLNNTRIEMAAYFRQHTMQVYETSAVYPFVDLIGKLDSWGGQEGVFKNFISFPASFGGLVGLFFGCSLIGITEIVYFFFFDVPKRGAHSLRSANRSNLKRQSLQAKRIIVKQYSKAELILRDNI